MNKNIRYNGIDLVLFDKNSTGNYKVYKSLSGHKFMFSYDTLIAIANMVGGLLCVTPYYRYSPTTIRHLSNFCYDYTSTTYKDAKEAQKNVSDDERNARIDKVISDIKCDIERWS